MERQCWANAQYFMWQFLELVGVSRSVSDNDLEEKVLKMFENVDYPTKGNNIEACHWISKKMKKLQLSFLAERTAKIYLTRRKS